MSNINITLTCPMCRKTHFIDVDEDKYQRFLNRRSTGEYIQNIFNTVESKVLREKLLSGYCDKCQSILFAPPED